MNFETNTIHAGCKSVAAARASSPAAHARPQHRPAVSSAFSYLLYSHRNNRPALYKQGYSLNVPNIVISARTSFPVSRDALKGAVDKL